MWMFELTVRNPVARLTAVADGVPGLDVVSQRAPRLSSLDGAQIGLWWNLKVGGDVALEHLAGAMAATAGTSSIPFYGRYPASKEMIAAAADRSQGVVGATAD
jgi:hypothetical protein